MFFFLFFIKPNICKFAWNNTSDHFLLKYTGMSLLHWTLSVLFLSMYNMICIVFQYLSSTEVSFHAVEKMQKILIYIYIYL